MTIAAIVLVAMGHAQIQWPIVALVWFLIGPVGIGVGFHRLFSHRQFETSPIIETALAVLGTLAAYAPVLFWASQHQYHHRHSDTDKDPSSPTQMGFWESFLWYRLRSENEKMVVLDSYCSKRILLNPTLRSLSRHFTKIVWGVILVLLLIDYNLLISAYLFPVAIEHLRINLVSSITHMNVPFSYRNFETEDTSQNNFVLGYLTMGFAWHNNHHNDERRLVLTHHWWELDVEGLIGKLLSRRS